MVYRGRKIDLIRLWERYVEFPPNLDTSGTFLSLVRCPNPNHDTLKRHFQINMQAGTVHCFAGCGISGTLEHALAVIHGYYDEAGVENAGDERERSRRIFKARKRTRREILSCGRIGEVSIPKRRRSTGRPTPVVQHDSISSYLPEEAIKYLDSRKINGSSISSWELQWDFKERRIVIPAKNENGILLFHIKRAVSEKQHPRYLYPESSGAVKESLLFGSCHIDPALIRLEGLILVEGALDAIRLHQMGFNNCVATLGASVSGAQVRKALSLRPKRIYLMFDKDSAGAGCTLKAGVLFKTAPILVCRYPKGRSDPAEMNREEVQRSLGRAIPFYKFLKLMPEVKGRRKVAEENQVQATSY
jgi:hypothetical protein